VIAVHVREQHVVDLLWLDTCGAQRLWKATGIARAEDRASPGIDQNSP